MFIYHVLIPASIDWQKISKTSKNCLKNLAVKIIKLSRSPIKGNLEIMDVMIGFVSTYDILHVINSSLPCLWLTILNWSLTQKYGDAGFSSGPYIYLKNHVYIITLLENKSDLIGMLMKH